MHTKFDVAIQSKELSIDIKNPNLELLVEASTLVISCVDFRLRYEVSKLLNTCLGLLGDYDELALPGASLAFDTPKYVHWQQTIEDVIALLQELHKIKRIVFLDHRCCGAYNMIKGKEAVNTREKEYDTHKIVLLKAKEYLREKFPALDVYTLLIGLDGVVEVIN